LVHIRQLATAFRAVLDEIQRISMARAIREHRIVHPTASLDSAITQGPIDQTLVMHGRAEFVIFNSTLDRVAGPSIHDRAVAQARPVASRGRSVF
jgi:hypothetical protein